MKMLMRIVLYCVGLLFMGLRSCLSVNSNLGVSPVNSLPYVISLIVHQDLGRCIIGVFVTYMVVQIIIKRKEYKWINLTQLIFSTIFRLFCRFQQRRNAWIYNSNLFRTASHDGNQHCAGSNRCGNLHGCKAREHANGGNDPCHQ